jgi:hypothetical protein
MKLFEIYNQLNENKLFNNTFMQSVYAYKFGADEFDGEFLNLDKLNIPSKFKIINGTIYRGLSLYKFAIKDFKFNLKELNSYTFDINIAKDFANLAGDFYDRMGNDSVLLKIDKLNSSKVVLNYVELFNDPEFISVGVKWAKTRDLDYKDFYKYSEDEVVCKGIDISDIESIFVKKTEEREFIKIK